MRCVENTLLDYRRVYRIAQAVAEHKPTRVLGVGYNLVERPPAERLAVEPITLRIEGGGDVYFARAFDVLGKDVSNDGGSVLVYHDVLAVFFIPENQPTARVRPVVYRCRQTLADTL